MPTDQVGNNNFPIGRLNNYDNGLKRYKGSLSLLGELECISELDKGSGSDDNKSASFRLEDSNQSAYAQKSARSGTEKE